MNQIPMDTQMQQPPDFWAQMNPVPGIDYTKSVRSALNPGNGEAEPPIHPRHDADLVRREEARLIELLQCLSEAERARLNDEIKLVPKYNDEYMPYIAPDGDKNNGDPPAFHVPQKIRLMSSYICNKLKEDPNEQIIELEITPFYLKLIVDYCSTFECLKVKSTIAFPAEYNNFQQNVAFREYMSLNEI